MEFEKVAEVVLPSGKFASMRALIVDDVLFATSMTTVQFGVTLLIITRVIQIDGLPVTMPQLLQMSMKELAPILRIVAEAVKELELVAVPQPKKD